MKMTAENVTITYQKLKAGGVNHHQSERKATFYLGDTVTFNENVRVIVYKTYKHS